MNLTNPTAKISRIEFDAFLEDTKPYLATNTIIVYRHTINDFMDFVKGRDVTVAMVEEWSAKCFRSGNGTSTVQRYRCALKSYFDWKIRHGTWTGPNPVWPMRNAKIIKTTRERISFTEADYRYMLAETEGTLWYAMIMVAWHTGLRLSDCAMLTWDNVDMEARAIRLVPIKTAKMGRKIEIPFGGELFGLFSTIKREGRFVNPPASVHYRYSGHSRLSSDFCMLMKRLKLVGKSFHSFRHTFITRQLAAGAQESVLAQVTGHNLNQIMTYTHFSLEDKRKTLAIS